MSPTDISGSDYAERSRRLIELTNDLKALGANHLLDIPRVVFIGNQSAGKSSVVEGVTGTKVPRDSGTCTRCPMECTMTKSSGRWNCSIKLRLEFENSGSPKLDPVTIHFTDLANPDEVDLWLKRAQAAVLFPGTLDEAQADTFRVKTSDEIKAMQDTKGVSLPFSFNTVELYVQDPQGTHLSFVDLPGIIQHHSTDKGMVELVKRLVRQAIRGLNTLVVLTIPMTDDVENQQAFELAKEADPQGLRTIGVGTKPDMLQPGNTGLIQNWQDIFQGRLHRLKHGYFCVKLPDDRTRAKNYSRSELQRQEQEYFESTDPWKGFPDRGRFGIPNFVRSTSKLLIDLIESNLPILRDEVDKLLAKYMGDYDKLPPLVNNDQPLQVILSRISIFCKAFEKTVHGDLNKDYTHRNQATYATFKREIVATTPIFDTGHRAPGLTDRYSAMATSVWMPMPMSVSRPTGLSPSPSPPTRPSPSPPTRPPPSPPPRITLGEVQTAIDKNLTWELPNYVPFEATKFFILLHVRKWNDPAVSCIHNVAKNMKQLIDDLLDYPDHFGRFPELRALIRTTTTTEEGTCFQEASATLKKLCNLENSIPLYTQNTTTYNAERQEWYRQNVEPQVPGPNDLQEEENQLKVMADVHAYFQIASKRFIDQIPLSIEGELHQNLASRLEQKLFQVVAAMDSAKLSDMLEEDPDTRARREHLTQRISRLKAIKQRLQEYERGSLSVPHGPPLHDR